MVALNCGYQQTTEQRLVNFCYWKKWKFPQAFIAIDQQIITKEQVLMHYLQKEAAKILITIQYTYAEILI